MPTFRAFFLSLLSSIAWWIGVVTSIGLAFFVNKLTDDIANSKFEHQVNNAYLAIQARLQSYADVLRATRALFHSSKEVTRSEFHTYVNNLQLAENYPGIQGINFARHIYHHDKEPFIRAIREDKSLNFKGYPSFNIRPSGRRNEYTVLIFSEPMHINPQAFGYDLSYAEIPRRALELARDTGEMISSGRVLQISGPREFVALAIRASVYRSDMPLDTVEQKRAAYYGSVGIGFDFHQLMKEAIGSSENLKHLHISVIDRGPLPEFSELTESQAFDTIFDSTNDLHGAHFSIEKSEDALIQKKISMSFASRIWDINFSSNKNALLDRFDYFLPYAVFIAGLLATSLLYGVYYFLLSARRRAIELANEMTKDLRRSEAHLAEAQHMANLGSWQFDPSAQTMQWSLETFRIFGHPPTTLVTFDGFLRQVHEDDRQTVKDGLEQAVISSIEFNHEHRIVRRDGSVRWVHTLCRPVKNDRRKKVRGTIMDITERKITMQALQRSQELLRELTAHQDRIKEEERRRIAREIHDELGQTLLALRIEISMLEARTSQNHPRLNARIRTALQQLDATVRSVRGIINDLRPAVLDLGLVAAIEWQVAEFRRRSDIECELFIDDPDIVVDNDSATTLFRILQESLTNIIRHAHASRIAVALYTQDGWLTLKIMDNGVGMAPGEQKKPDSFGLVGIEERVLALNGRFSISSMPNNGTTLLVAIPYTGPSDSKSISQFNINVS